MVFLRSDDGISRVVLTTDDDVSAGTKLRPHRVGMLSHKASDVPIEKFTYFLLLYGGRQYYRPPLGRFLERLIECDYRF